MGGLGEGGGLEADWRGRATKETSLRGHSELGRKMVPGKLLGIHKDDPN